MEQARQGDVFLEKVQSLPAGNISEVATDGGDVVLAYGEVTGHKHRIRAFQDTGALPARLFDVGEMRFLDVTAPAMLIHEEHAPISLEPGIYRVSRYGIGTQREYSPKAILPVLD